MSSSEQDKITALEKRIEVLENNMKRLVHSITSKWGMSAYSFEDRTIYDYDEENDKIICKETDSDKILWYGGGVNGTTYH